MAPYFFENPEKRQKLPRTLDRRVKLSEEERNEIKKRKDRGDSIRGIARDFAHVSRRTIQYTLYPERAKKVALQAKRRQQHKRTYERVRGTEWNKIVKEHRNYKYKALKKLQGL